ncbi:hypothetical protein UFOVP609_16 [uncultured Caudovirales phage]|uniref:Scaffolding protein n=1 Tax=uncultured Caudovirales phage TaxID=2100421 RepID=A0A6J5N5F8_9CAUD|nr:hypothetical protein UFOVP609_16 [uncultured Caudovirales phage]
MSEETTPTTEEATTEAVQEPQGSPETDWKAEARKWETRAKADHEAANQWREFETNQKSEVEKMADELARFKAEASESSTKLLKFEVASQKGIPAEAMELLNGSTREELERAADKLLSLIADQSKPNTPKPDLNQGKPPVSGVSTGDQFAAALASIL